MRRRRHLSRGLEWLLLFVLLLLAWTVGLLFAECDSPLLPLKVESVISCEPPHPEAACVVILRHRDGSFSTGWTSFRALPGDEVICRDGICRELTNAKE